MWNTLKNFDYRVHLVVAILIRILFIAYGLYHDEVFSVPYTDVDYKVFTDASRHVLDGNSPYNRSTYRYSPLLAIILIPNILLHNLYGKVLFSFIDILVGLLIRTIVLNNLKELECYKQKCDLKGIKSDSDVNLLNKPNLKSIRQRKRSRNDRFDRKYMKIKSENEVQADVSMLIWLYNPLTVAIATRGNSDSIAGFLVLLTLYFLQCKRCYFISGLIHGVSIHFRLYPIAYSLAMFMYLSKFSYYTTNRFLHSDVKVAQGKKPKELKNMENKLVKNSKKDVALLNETPERKTIFKKEYILYLIPNVDQLKLILGCLISLSSLTFVFYLLYDYEFLYETYIYHLVRKDTRHNFSLYFYLQYLTAGVKNIGLWQKVLILLPQIILLLVFSIRYGLNKFTINFSLLTQTVVMVAYNTVLTSQYFVWILVVLPLCIWQIKISLKTSMFLICIWFIAQGAWLMPAYFLEFQGQNTFLFIWLQSVSFFCANIAILGRFIMYYMPVKKIKY